MKGVPMNRSLLVLALCFLAAPAYSMTATVQSTAQPPASGAPTGASAPAGSATTSGAASAAARPAAPSAASVTRPVAVLAAPGVPAKSTVVPGRRTDSHSILPSVAPQSVALPPNSAGWTTIASQGSGMHKGTLQALNAGGGTFQVYGQKLTFDAQRVKVFNSDGSPGSVLSLKNGANVRFTLDPTDLLHRRVAVIYVN
jgi:hypothetical protein